MAANGHQVFGAEESDSGPVLKAHGGRKKQVGKEDHKNLEIANLKSRKANGGVQINPYLTVSQKMTSKPDVHFLAPAPGDRKECLQSTLGNSFDQWATFDF